MESVPNIRKAYIEFFVQKKHAVIPSSPLILQNDSTTLFTSSGMQPMIPYLLGQPHHDGTRLVNSQICFRSEDIEDVGDNRHGTFFEMLGNWSLGDYFKEEQLPWIFEFLTKIIGLDPNKLYMTVFGGDEKNGLPRDDESPAILRKLYKEAGIVAKTVTFSTLEEAAEKGLQDGRIFFYPAKKNWWSRSGTPDKMPISEIGGPDSEIFYEFSDIPHDTSFSDYCHPNCDCGRFMEIGNSVFMQYQKQADGSFKKLAQQNVDFGGGLARIYAAKQNDPDIYKIPLLLPIIQEIELVSAASYSDNAQAMRVIADHIVGSVFMAAEGVKPSNKQQGYILRRLLRRAIMNGLQIGIDTNFLSPIIETVISLYEDDYPYLREQSNEITNIVEEEERKFRQTLARGLAQLLTMMENWKNENDSDLITQNIFDLYQSYGFPVEVSYEEIKKHGSIDGGQLEQIIDRVKEKINRHQDQSRTASAGMFKGGLADSSEQTTKYHTATHLLNAALRQVLGRHIMQKGSNITQERLRFDFSHPDKLTDEQIKKVEVLVNEQIKKDLPVTSQEMTLEEARAAGALGVFGERYSNRVTVYSIGDFSREICGGPHVVRTGLLGVFKILKEESSGSGVRRIKAVLA